MLSRLRSRIFGNGSAHISPEPQQASEARYFLIVYDPKAQQITECREYPVDEEAEAALIDAEESHRESESLVVMFQADSFEDLKQTHPHYFEDRAANTAPFPLVEA